MNQDDVEQAMRLGFAFNAPENRRLFHDLTTVDLEHIEALTQAGWKLRELRPDLRITLGWLPPHCGAECVLYVRRHAGGPPDLLLALDPGAEGHGRADRPWAVLWRKDGLLAKISDVPEDGWHASALEALVAWLVEAVRG